MGRGGDETFPKFAESFAESFANILAKFHELKISNKPQHCRITYRYFRFFLLQVCDFDKFYSWTMLTDLSTFLYGTSRTYL